MKEFFRKMLVSIKRNPQIFAGIVLAGAFLYYSLNLTKISNTTAKVQGRNMGLFGFITMLFSILVFVCFLNAFPKRKKANVPMLVLMYAIFAIIITADIFYRTRIAEAAAKEEFRRVLDENPYIFAADKVVLIHIILIFIVAVLIALMPVYGRLLKKINTSIEVEGYGKLDKIDIDGEV
ncbi:MAG: hypothetical protein K6E62_04300 [Lachnospiraceae bacterium]|nr:hypothetical protein [Lachnospiraceae bacterium]